MSFAYRVGSFNYCPSNAGQLPGERQRERFVLQSNLLMDSVHLPSDNELLSLQNKSGRIKSAAVQFVKADWGA